jgi:hypothetical protein
MLFLKHPAVWGGTTQSTPPTSGNSVYSNCALRLANSPIARNLTHFGHLG